MAITVQVEDERGAREGELVLIPWAWFQSTGMDVKEPDNAHALPGASLLLIVSRNPRTSSNLVDVDAHKCPFNQLA